MDPRLANMLLSRISGPLSDLRRWVHWVDIVWRVNRNSDLNYDFNTSKMLQLELKLWTNSLSACSEAYQSSPGACYYFHRPAAAYSHPATGYHMSWSNSEQRSIVVRGMKTEMLTLSTNPKHSMPQTLNFSQHTDGFQPYQQKTS